VIKRTTAAEAAAEAAGQAPPVWVTRTPASADQLDFSEFHDLMHSIWHCLRCKNPADHIAHAGGWQRHLAMKWTYQWSDRVRALVWCTIFRRHDFTAAYRRDGTVAGISCRDCSKPS
jgi:hypothetical protein